MKAGDFGIVFILATADSVVEDGIDGADDIGNVFGFAGNGTGEFGGGSWWSFGEFAEELLGHPGSDDSVALIIEVNAVAGVGMCALVGFIGKGVQVEEDGVVAGGDFLDGLDVGGDLLVAFGWIGEEWVLFVLSGNG